MIYVSILAVLAITWLVMSRWLNTEVVREAEIHNPGGGAGTALVLYRMRPNDEHYVDPNRTERWLCR
jgi:hypothetical protein